MKSKQEKRTDAVTRNLAWAALNPEQQLERINLMGFVAKRQRDRIAVAIHARDNPPKPRDEANREHTKAKKARRSAAKRKEKGK